ncbi:hypothetical protein BDZ45DRAFT_347451 [Acephala macrosclerotiorum]|nr:hypothetical protein BDZ45DRAFT_347451 [Acephala macrosclerotiorum]
MRVFIISSLQSFWPQKAAGLEMCDLNSWNKRPGRRSGVSRYFLTLEFDIVEFALFQTYVSDAQDRMRVRGHEASTRHVGKVTFLPVEQAEQRGIKSCDSFGLHGLQQ